MHRSLFQVQQLFSALLVATLTFAFPFALTLQAESPNLFDQPAATTITINASDDPDNSLSRTCNYTSGIFNAASDGKCTFRRAILEAAARPPSDRPITIQFNLPITDTNKDLEVAGTWTLDIEDDLPPLETQSISNLTGKVTIDGNTQPGGRTNGPKIILNTKKFSLQIESEENIIRNLAFKGGGGIFLKENGNLVEKIWMGLSDDGQKIVFQGPQAMNMAGGGIFISSDDNIVQDNVIAGASASAVDVNAGNQNNLIQRNLIGMRADGTAPIVAVPSQCLRSLALDSSNWYGGWGIALNGSNNQVLNNRIAGLHRVQSENETPPIAIAVDGSNQLIQNNIIGIDGTGKYVGVCGQGIQVGGRSNQILDNVIANSRKGFDGDESSYILATGDRFNFGEVTVRRNLTVNGPGDIYLFGPNIPNSLKSFLPAKVTNINGKTVTGTSGTGSPCPGCLIDFYTDDTDDIGETVSYLGSTTADSNGDFSFTMTQTLPSGVGIRTSSTTQSSGVIGSFLAGTTTQFSKLYLPMSKVEIAGPITGTVGVTYTFTITVSPIGATTPLSYTLKATDYNQGTFVRDAHVLTFPLRWTAAGAKELDIEVKNELGTVTDSHTITLSSGSGGSSGKIYLPLVVR